MWERTLVLYGTELREQTFTEDFLFVVVMMGYCTGTPEEPRTHQAGHPNSQEGTASKPKPQGGLTAAFPFYEKGGRGTFYNGR